MDQERADIGRRVPCASDVRHALRQQGVSQKGAPIAYSDFRAKVAADAVKEVAIAPDRITGELKSGERFTANAVPDPQLSALLDAL